MLGIRHRGESADPSPRRHHPYHCVPVGDVVDTCQSTRMRTGLGPTGVGSACRVDGRKSVLPSPPHLRQLACRSPRRRGRFRPTERVLRPPGPQPTLASDLSIGCGEPNWTTPPFCLAGNGTRGKSDPSWFRSA